MIVVWESYFAYVDKSLAHAGDPDSPYDDDKTMGPRKDEVRELRERLQNLRRELEKLEKEEKNPNKKNQIKREIEALQLKLKFPGSD